MADQSEDFLRLRDMVQKGYYKEDTGIAQSDLTPIPWANKRCKDCPFFEVNAAYVHAPGKCRLRGGLSRQRTDHTCRYFDLEMHAEAEAIINTHNPGALREWCTSLEPIWWS